MKRIKRKEPAATYAHIHWDQKNRRLWFDYNGRDIISMEIPGEDKVRFRRASNGLIQSAPVVQQNFIALAAGTATVRVTFTMSGEAVNMRPRRARPREAVLGSHGRPTIPGLNGLYDILDDLLIDWHGQPWKWLDPELKRNEDGTLSAAIEVKLDARPLVINIRPLYYNRHLGYKFHRPWERRPNTKAVAGWCSWEAYRREVSEEKILNTARFFAETVRDYGLEYIQLDDGYQRIPVKYPVSQSLRDAWMRPNENFPSGFKKFTDEIKALGFQPGIWMSTDAEEIEKEADGSDCRLRGPDGEQVMGFWMRAIPDCLPETIAKHIRPLYEGIRENGFTYVKIDQVRHLLSDALHEAVRAGYITNEEAEQRFRNYMETTRAALGDDVYFLSSWGVLTEVVGICDACRIAIDTSPRWKAVRSQIVESAHWWHTQRILFLNDPDHLCVRTKPEWAQSLLSFVSLSGELLMLSDPLESYDETRLEYIRKCLPPLTTTSGETGPLDMHYPVSTVIKEHGAAFKGEIKMAWDDVSDKDAFTLAGYHETMHDDHPLASLWAFHLNTRAGKWCTALRFAGTPLRACTVNLASLYLDSEKTYIAFDFWTQKYLGQVKQAIDVPALSLGCCQVISFREVLDRPQFLASSRHVSMDAVSVKAQEWNEGVLTLSLEGVPNTTEDYWFHCPAGWSLEAVKATGAKVETETIGETVRVTVSFKNKKAILRFRWTK